MPTDDGPYLAHMLDTARRVTARVEGISRVAYDEDEDLRLALAHLIQVIGEAARRVSSETRAEHPEIPWRNIIGMRHKIVHDYMDVDEDIVWVVAKYRLASLIDALPALVPPEES